MSGGKCALMGRDAEVTGDSGENWLTDKESINSMGDFRSSSKPTP